LQGSQGLQGPQGDTGATGSTGPQGPAGTLVSQYAHIYNTGAQVVEGDAAVTFGQNGLMSSGITHTAGQSSITVNTAGTYLITFHAVSTMCTGGFDCVWTVYVNGTAVPAGRVFGTDSQLLAGSVLVQLTAGAVVTLRNESDGYLEMPNYWRGGANAAVTFVRIN
jgi:hypothetical protein